MLAVHELTKSFGNIEALRGISFSVGAGEIHGVCGENGAGKSTLMKSLMGIVRPDSGTIEMDGKTRAIESPQRAQECGIALVAQELSLAPHLSVLDNIWLGHRDVPVFHRRSIFRQRAAKALQSLGAEFGLDRLVGSLSAGERQIVEIARLLVREARLLILDEPTATLSDVEIARMMDALRTLKAGGSSVLYVTHRLSEIFDVCDSVTVLRNGRHVTTRPVAGLERKELIELMLGRRLEEMYPAPPVHSSTSRALTASNLRIPGIVDDFSIVARRGEVTCIAGQVGAGPAAIIRALAGLIPEASGEIMLDGVRLPIGSVTKRARRNIAFVSEDRGREGLFRRSVLENVAAVHFPECRRGGLVSWDKVRRFAFAVCRRVLLDEDRLNANAFDLSGGNQQKILFARALESKQPGVILINEPTRGVDVGARAEIYRLLREFCQMGYVILMASTDLEEVVGISDSVVTMYRGRPVSRYERGQIDMSAIVADITHPIHNAA